MRVHLLYFAAVRDLVGRSGEIVELPEDVRTIGALARFLEHRVPSLAGRLARVRMARSESFADPDEAISEGDVIALIPPVAGGAMRRAALSFTCSRALRCGCAVG